MDKKAGVITHKFPNGREFTGSLKELQAVAVALGQPIIGLTTTPKGYYNSSSDGLVEIKSMNSHHIRRTILNVGVEYLKNVFVSKDTNSVFIKKFSGLIEDQTIQDMLFELVARGDEEPVKTAAILPVGSPKKSSKKESKKK